jgi:hypothetical protein
MLVFVCSCADFNTLYYNTRNAAADFHSANCYIIKNQTAGDPMPHCGVPHSSNLEIYARQIVANDTSVAIVRSSYLFCARRSDETAGKGPP